MMRLMQEADWFVALYSAHHESSLADFYEKLWLGIRCKGSCVIQNLSKHLFIESDKHSSNALIFFTDKS